MTLPDSFSAVVELAMGGGSEERMEEQQLRIRAKLSSILHSTNCYLSKDVSYRHLISINTTNIAF